MIIQLASIYLVLKSNIFQGKSSGRGLLYDIFDILLSMLIIGSIWIISFVIGFMPIFGIGMLLANKNIIFVGSESWKGICLMAGMFGLSSIAVSSLWVLGMLNKKSKP